MDESCCDLRWLVWRVDFPPHLFVPWIQSDLAGALSGDQDLWELSVFSEYNLVDMACSSRLLHQHLEGVVLIGSSGA